MTIARLSALVGGAAVGAMLSSCYSLQPMGKVAPTIGTEVALDVNDAGRVALGGSMGPEIARIEGRLVEKDSSAYLMAVSHVQLLRGGEQVWRGEKVRIRSDNVSTVYERHFDRGRSLALGAAGISGVAFLLTRSILGVGAGDRPRIPGDTAPAIRLRLRASPLRRD